MATPASVVDINAAAKALGMTVEEVKKRMAKNPVTATVVVGKDPTFDVDVNVMAQNVKDLYEAQKQNKADFKVERSDIIKLITDMWKNDHKLSDADIYNCLLYTSPSPRDRQKSRMPSSA